MKIGAEDKKKVGIMAVLLAIAIPLVFFGFRSASAPAAAPAAAESPAAAASSTSSRPSQKKNSIPQSPDTLDPTLRTDVLTASQKIEYKGGTRNIFRMEEPPPPPKLPEPIVPPRPVTPQPPPHTPVNLKYYGFSARPGEPIKAFLQEGEELFVAKEGDIVNRRYKVLKITRTSVLLEDVLENFQQTIPLIAAATPG